MATRDSIRPTRRALLAGVAATLPAIPALALPAVITLDTQGAVEGHNLAYLANNLRRADDKAQRIGAPLQTAECWRWITHHAETVRDLEPLDYFELHADITNMSWQDRLDARPKCLKIIKSMQGERLRMSDLV